MKRILALSMVLVGVGNVAPTFGDDEPVVDPAAREHALKDLNGILTKARAVPNFENGQPAGYRIVQPQEGGTYQKLELQNGGVVTTVDQQPVAQPDQEQN